MSLSNTTLELCGLALGASYLWFKHWQRVRDWTLKEDPKKWIGHGIEVSQLKPRIEHVRQRQFAGRHRLSDASFHLSLLEMARLAVSQLSYFRGRHMEQNSRKRGR